MPPIHHIIIKQHKIIEHFSNFLQQNRFVNLKEKPEKLIVDLCSVKFILPYHIAPIACLIEEYYRKGVEIDFKRCGSKAEEYLEDIKFFEYWQKGYNRKRYTKTKKETTLCLWNINYEMIYSYVTYSQQYFQKNFFSGHSLSPLNIAMAEILNNINDHSQSDITGYVITQLYPKKFQIILSVCDFGVGIPTSVNKYLKKNENRTVRSDRALLLAFKEGFSTKSTPRNRGFGLNTLSSIAKELNGRILLISNNANITQNEDGVFEKEIMDANFPGTQIVLYLDTRHLPPIEPEEFAEIFEL